MLPPLWERKGVTLIAAAENYQITLKMRVSTEPLFYLFPGILTRGAFEYFLD